MIDDRSTRTQPLLLGVLALVSTSGPGEEVIVDDTPCVVITEDGENGLYCRR